MPAPRTMFTSVFTPGETVTDAEFTRFEKFLPRLQGESHRAYADRLEVAGLAFATSAEDIHDNIEDFRHLVTAARDAGIPVALLTGTVPHYSDLPADKTAQDYLTEARAQAQADGNP